MQNAVIQTILKYAMMASCGSTTHTVAHNLMEAHPSATNPTKAMYVVRLVTAQKLKCWMQTGAARTNTESGTVTHPTAAFQETAK